MQHNFEKVKNQIESLLREVSVLQEAKVLILDTVKSKDCSMVIIQLLLDIDKAVRTIQAMSLSMFEGYTTETIAKYNSGHITQIELIEALRWDMIYLNADHLQGVFTRA